MSKIEVDAIEPQSGTTLTLGASGDSVNIASGATITDFTSTGIDDNASSTAITIDSNERVGIGTASPQPFKVNTVNGSGMGSYPTWEATTGRNLALFETDQSEGTFVLGSPTGGYAQLGFADPAHKASGRVGYDHSADAMVFGTNSGAERMRINSSGHVLVGTTSSPSSPLAGNVYIKVGTPSIEGNGTADVSVSTTDVSLSNAKGAGFGFVGGYNTSTGAQFNAIVQFTLNASVTVVSIINNTGLTLTFSAGSGILKLKTSSGTVAANYTVIGV